MPKVVITMPAYRAEATLARTLADIPPGVADELILVDDASPDGTAALARSLGIKVRVHDRNRGYGGNQKTCYVEALSEGADVVVMLHPDYQYDPKAVPLLIAPILAGDADMTFGSRFAGLGDPRAGGMPLYRFVGNRLTTSVENMMLGSRFTDMHSGLRAYTRKALLSLPFLRYDEDFVFDSQFLVDAVTSGLRVVEVPIPTRYTKESSSIAIGPSVHYVSSSVGYSAKQSLRRGRRGLRTPVTSALRRKGPSLGGGAAVKKLCVLCGGTEHVVVYPRTAEGAVPVEEFACTTSGLSLHDDIVQCVRCGLVASVPTLEPTEIRDNYEEVVDEAYLREEPARREVFEWFAKAALGYPTRGNRLFEIGCHVGLFLDVAKEHGWDVGGVEPSMWAAAEGRRRYGIPIRQGTVEELDEPRASADVVVMLDVLEHLFDPMAGLAKARDILQDEGLLVLSTVNLDGLHAKVRKGSWPWFIRSHLYYFSEATLGAMLAEAGFRMVEWATVPRSFHVSYIAHRAAESHSGLGKLAGALARLGDPRIPLGWLGDITFVAARPLRPSR